MTTVDIKHFEGQHCETTATGTLLKQLGVTLSEPMLFGLGEGLGFIYWKTKAMDFPFLGGRIKPDMLTQNLTKNLGLTLTVKETSSKDKAWEDVKKLLDKKQAVGLKLDCYYLEYFTQPIHFAGHYVAIYGYDSHDAYLIDTMQQGAKVKTSLTSLASARSAKGPMSSKSLYYTIAGVGKVDLEQAVRGAIINNANTYLSPPINNISYKGIWKAGRELVKCFGQAKDVEMVFSTVAMLMEKAGTGGALFRNFYRDFLKEAHELLGTPELNKAHLSFREIAEQWTMISSLLQKTGETGDVKYTEEAAKLLQIISQKEKEVFEMLHQL